MSEKLRVQLKLWGGVAAFLVVVAGLAFGLSLIFMAQPPSVAPERVFPAAGAGTFSPDGERLLLGGADGELRLWDLRQAEERRRFADGEGESAGAVQRLVFLPDGRRALAVSLGEATDYERPIAFRLWDLEAGTVTRTSRLTMLPGCIEFSDAGYSVSADGKQALLVLGGEGNLDLRLWDLERNLELATLKPDDDETDRFLSAVLAPDGGRALAGHLCKPVQLRTLPGGEKLREFDLGRAIPRRRGEFKDWLRQTTANAFAFSPDGGSLLVGALDGDLFLWDLESGRLLRHFRRRLDVACGLAFSPDGRFALVAGGTGDTETQPVAALYLLDLASGRTRLTFTMPPAAGEAGGNLVLSAAFAPDGRRRLGRLARFEEPGVLAGQEIVLWSLPEEFYCPRRKE